MMRVGRIVESGLPLVIDTDEEQADRLFHVFSVPKRCFGERLASRSQLDTTILNLNGGGWVHGSKYDRDLMTAAVDR